MEYRVINIQEINTELFKGFNRRQEVHRCWRRVNGCWTIKDVSFVDQWGEKEYEELVRCLRNTISTGGVVYGAFEGNILKGFASVEREAFGSTRQYLDLTSLHVSEEQRGKGIGRQLFSIAAEWAKEHGGRKLYISAHSSLETQAFYHAVGCCEAKDHSRDHVEKEPWDCQLEYALYPEECSISYREIDSSFVNQVKEIYKRESWNSYLKDDAKLIRAFDNSLYISGAFDGDRLVGLIRCVGDGEHVLVVQDLIVDSPYQKRGIGSRLFKDAMDKYSQARMFMAITDMEDKVDNRFYQSFGLVKVKERSMVCYIR